MVARKWREIGTGFREMRYSFFSPSRFMGLRGSVIGKILLKWPRHFFGETSVKQRSPLFVDFPALRKHVLTLDFHDFPGLDGLLRQSAVIQA
jgi:hypothetical protein